MKTRNPKIPTTLDCAGRIDELRVRLPGDNHDVSVKLDAEGRRDVLREVRNKEFDSTLEVDAVTYIQRDTPNRNFVRFKRGNLQRIAKSFVGQPFLRDHAHDDVTARGGTITRSAKVMTDEGPAIAQTFELVKPWAIESALDGTMDRFSISWHAETRPECSDCKEPILSAIFGGGDCAHMPGDELDNGKFVEAIYNDATGTETSMVNVPAVEGTAIEGIRAALAAQVKQFIGERDMNLTAIGKALGLEGEDFTEDQIRSEAAQLRELIRAERDSSETLRKQLASANERLDEIEAEQSKVAVDSLVRKAIEEGRCSPAGDDGMSPTEEAIRMFGSADIDKAAKFVSRLPQVVPVGAPASVGTEAPAQVRNVIELSAEQVEMNALFGISNEDFAKQNMKEGD